MGERALDGEMAVLGRNGGFGPDAPVVPARSLHAAGSVRRFESLRGRCRRPRLRNHLLPWLGRLAGPAVTAFDKSEIRISKSETNSNRTTKPNVPNSKRRASDIGSWVFEFV